MIRSRALIPALMFAMTLVAAPAAHAIPALQLYSPDAVYDQNLETWVLTEGTFELWVVGNTSEFGGIYDTIFDVDLAGSYYGSSGSITVTLLSDGTEVAHDADPTNTPAYDQVINHDEYKSADGHEFWTLGDLAGTPDTIEDYAGDGTGTGKILKLMVSISGYEAVHFDAFNHYVTETGAGYKNHYKFAPYSHDATGGGGGGGGGGGSAPEPGSFWMLGAGLAGLVATARRKRNR